MGLRFVTESYLLSLCNFSYNSSFSPGLITSWLALNLLLINSILVYFSNIMFLELKPTSSPRFLDGRSILLPSVPVSLCCLSLARTYRLPYFLTHTANYLLASLTPHTVLAVLQAVLPYSSYSLGARQGQEKDRQGPSAPELWHLENTYQGVEEGDNQVTGGTIAAKY